MSRLVCILWLSAAIAASGQVRPHHRGATPFPFESAAASAQRLPFETPPSLACVYRLVPDLVAGCPVNGTHALPGGGSGLLVIVNAFDYPTADNDLNAFSRQFGIPECSTANPCFRKVYATGVAPPVDSLWPRPMSASSDGTLPVNVGFGEVIWAAIINVAGSGASDTATEQEMLYSNNGNTGVFRDIRLGQAFEVHALPGWDFLTGLPVTLAGK